MIHPNTSDIKHYFIDALANEQFVTDRTGQTTIEMIGASFMADKPAIFGTPNEDYIEKELAWYNSQICNVNAISVKYLKLGKWQQTIMAKSIQTMAT